LGVTICGASFKNELLVDIVDAREEIPDTPDRELCAYGALGGIKIEDGASEAGLTKSSRMSISGPAR